MIANFPIKIVLVKSKNLLEECLAGGSGTYLITLFPAQVPEDFGGKMIGGCNMLL